MDTQRQNTVAHDSPPTMEPVARTIILDGSVGMRHWRGECPRSPLLWPVLAEPAVVRVLRGLAAHAVEHVTVCGPPSLERLCRSAAHTQKLKVSTWQESLPGGPAGVFSSACPVRDHTTVLLVAGNLPQSPPIDMIQQEHLQARADLTIAVAAQADKSVTGDRVVAWLMGPQALRFAAVQGYADLKEGLIPLLVRQGLQVHLVPLPDFPPAFRDWRGYLHSLATFLHTRDRWLHKPHAASDFHQRIWISDAAQVAQSARICGPVAVMPGAVIEENALVIGPAVIESGAVVGPGSAVIASSLWENARVGAGCELRQSLLTDGACLCAGESADQRLVSLLTTRRVRKNVHPETTRQTMDEKRTETTFPPRRAAALIAPVGAVTVALIWSYWPTLRQMWQIWLGSDEYSSGLLVPPLAAWLVWSQRHVLRTIPTAVSLVGLGGIFLAQVLRHLGVYFMYASAERLSFVLTIMALIAFLLGRRCFLRLLPILLFLLLMLPLPKKLESRVTLPLQQWATESAVFSLEVLGYDVTRDGNIIHVDDSAVAVAEACNGLRMVTGFVIIAALVALVIHRPRWHKAVLLLSSLPIAFFCNTVRLTGTSIAFAYLDNASWQDLFHDYGGYAMMPLGLLIVMLELSALERLLPVTTPGESHPSGMLVTERRN